MLLSQIVDSFTPAKADGEEHTPLPNDDQTRKNI
jgi:hypothetical protein